MQVCMLCKHYFPSSPVRRCIETLYILQDLTPELLKVDLFSQYKFRYSFLHYTFKTSKNKKCIKKTCLTISIFIGTLWMN